MTEWERTRAQAESECSIGWQGWVAAVLVAGAWLVAGALMEVVR